MADQEAPTLGDLLALGGWNGRFARVLAVAFNGHNGVVVVDVNGDGTMIEVDDFSRDPDGRIWPGDSTGAGELVWQSDNAGVVHAVGKGRIGPAVIEIAGEHLNVTAGEAGWWAWVRPSLVPPTDVQS